MTDTVTVKELPIRKYIKCRYCKYRTPMWTRTKEGKPKSGWGRLSAHAFDKHEDVFLDIQDYLHPSELAERSEV